MKWKPQQYSNVVKGEAMLNFFITYKSNIKNDVDAAVEV